MSYFRHLQAAHRWGCGLVVLAIVATGCSQRGDLSGKVTYNSKPVVYGSVVVVGSDNIPVTGPINSDGSYTVSNVPTGPVQLAVSSPLPIPGAGPPAKDTPAPSGGGKGKPRRGPNDPPPDAPPGWFAIPAQYSEPDKSGIKTTIKSGPNTYDITIP